jgi:ATP-binding cassette subfamily F protein 3
MLLGKDNNYEGLLRLGEWVKYSYMGQEVLFENDKLSMLQLIMSKRELQEAVVREHLARFQFYGDEVDKSIEVLSGGERVRLYLACVMLEDADCLILDEPTNHLDMPARDAVEAALQEFKGTIIAVTHDRYYLTHCVSKILEIENGKIITYEGNYDLFKKVKYGIDEGSTEKRDTKPAERLKRNTLNKKPAGAKSDNPEKHRQDIEAQIINLEEKIKEMEGLFDISTPREKYQEYGELLNEVEQLYSKWNDMIT